MEKPVLSDNSCRTLCAATMLPALSLLDTRVLGVLVEKELTVPDIYPLSLNALTAGCNQKNNRDPLLNASEAEVQAAIDRLQPLTLVIESSGSRVMRYSQNVARVLRVSSEAVALLAVLWLRGPQTAAELRAATERLHRFADVSSVEGFLQQLAARRDEAGGPLVVLLRGRRERANRAGLICCLRCPPKTARRSPSAARTERPRRGMPNSSNCAPSWPNWKSRVSALETRQRD